MDIYSSTFSYPWSGLETDPAGRSSSHKSSNGHDSQDNAQDPATIHGVHLYSIGRSDAVQAVALSAAHSHGCYISFSQSPHGAAWNFHVTGSSQQVQAVRGKILRSFPSQFRTILKALHSDLLDSSCSTPSIKTSVRVKLDDIADQSQTLIAVVNENPAPTDHSWSENDRMCDIAITGPGVDQVEIARVRLLVMLDELSGLYSDTCEIDHKLHPILAGRRRSVIQSIQQETACNFYFPSPLLGQTDDEPGVEMVFQHRNKIWITGDFVAVRQAKDMLLQLARNKTLHDAITSQIVAILPRKADWILLECKDKLKEIMSDTSTFVDFAGLGRPSGLVTFYGDNKGNIRRSIRSVMRLAAHFYVGSLWLLMSQPLSNIWNASQMAQILKRVSDSCGAEIAHTGTCFEIYGVESTIRKALAMFSELDMVKMFQHETRIQLELANEHRDFVSGKKNGKINKIMHTADVKIVFETFSDQNFVIDVSGNYPAVMQGLTLLQEEMPAEISFYVPEIHHKRIIGVGGKSIQKIMKKYGVYVKFLNAEEMSNGTGYGAFGDNVIARTPNKNAFNLDQLKRTIMELANTKEHPCSSENLSIPRKYHRNLFLDDCQMLRSIENKTGCHVIVPQGESASDTVTITGPENQIQLAASLLLENVPFETSVVLPENIDLTAACASPEFKALVDRVQRDFKTSIALRPLRASNQGPDTLHSEASLRLTATRGTLGSLSEVRALVEHFFLRENVTRLPHSQRAHMFSKSLFHFDDAPQPREVVDKKLRMATSSPDVKSLFKDSPYAYPFPQDDSVSQVSTYDQPARQYWSPVSQAVNEGSIHNHRNAEDVLKRGSDSLLEAKLRDKLSKPRNAQNRAQSLDLTSSLSKIAEHGVPPESPTQSTIEDDIIVSPSLMATPSFPSVYGPPPRTTGSQDYISAAAWETRRPLEATLDDEQVEEVSRVMSSLGL